MRTRTKELDGLLRLPSLGDRSARKAAFVAAVNALARGAMEGEPSALDGVEPAALSAAVKTAIGANLFEDPELPATTLAVAMFELGGALAPGAEKREVGRRVLAMLHEGSAEVIAAIATRMAVASRKGLATSAVTARLALIFAMPLPTPFSQALAWAICTQAELAREWIAVASIGSLAERTTAARILEQAAVVAARRRADGDDEATVLFATDPIARAFARLVRDRDLGVWRHAASARGLIAGGSTRGWRDLGEALNAPLSGVDWRRAAVAIVASSAIDPDRGLRKSREILGGALPAHDRGLVGAMVWGLPRVFDELPDHAEELARALVQTDAAGTAEPLALLLGETGEIGGDARAGC